jgi:hypothetical protein
MYLYYKKQKGLYTTFEFQEAFTELSCASAGTTEYCALAEETNDMRSL